MILKFRDPTDVPSTLYKFWGFLEQDRPSPEFVYVMVSKLTVSRDVGGGFGFAGVTYTPSDPPFPRLAESFEAAMPEDQAMYELLVSAEWRRRGGKRRYEASTHE